MDKQVVLKKFLELCTNKPTILVDRDPWYPDALNSLGLRWHHVTFGMRNIVEHWFGYIKARTKGFYNNFPKQLNFPEHQDLH